MKQLKKWIDKEVEITLSKNKLKLRGFIWCYQTSATNKTPEYWIGYDGGMMDYIKPSMIESIHPIVYIADKETYVEWCKDHNDVAFPYFDELDGKEVKDYNPRTDDHGTVNGYIVLDVWMKAVVKDHE